jgi:hypothetical protein
LQCHLIQRVVNFADIGVGSPTLALLIHGQHQSYFQRRRKLTIRVIMRQNWASSSARSARTLLRAKPWTMFWDIQPVTMSQAEEYSLRSRNGAIQKASMVLAPSAQCSYPRTSSQTPTSCACAASSTTKRCKTAVQSKYNDSPGYLPPPFGPFISS